MMFGFPGLLEDFSIFTSTHINTSQFPILNPPKLVDFHGIYIGFPSDFGATSASPRQRHRSRCGRHGGAGHADLGLLPRVPWRRGITWRYVMRYINELLMVDISPSDPHVTKYYIYIIYIYMYCTYYISTCI